MIRGKKNPKVVVVGGGVGSSTFTKALLPLPVELKTIVSTFDDGGSTGAMRRDYGGVALGDLRQCFLASFPVHDGLLDALNYRFGRGNLYGVNVGNILMKAFLAEHGSEREGIERLHKLLNMRNEVIPVSYAFAKLTARLANGATLGDQDRIATHLNFSEAAIKSLGLSRRAPLNLRAKKALLEADFALFAPGNFFTSLLPHLYVEGFAKAWKKSRAEKIWVVNLLAHKGQDSFYTLRDYLRWFEKSLGPKPFDCLVLNTKIPAATLRGLRARFAPLRITPADRRYAAAKGIKFTAADLVSRNVRRQDPNDTVLRAPLRHDAEKVRKFFDKFFRAS